MPREYTGVRIQNSEYDEGNKESRIIAEIAVLLASAFRLLTPDS